MELRRLMLCVGVLLVAVLSCSSDAHSIQRREPEPDRDYDTFLNDAEADSDDGAQNDADGGNDSEDDDEVVGTILTEPTIYTPNRGSSLRLECNTEPKSKDVVVQWKKDGDAYYIGNSKTWNSDRISIVTNTKDLLINDLEPSDSGKYECSIVQSKPVVITHTVLVQEPPRIIRFMASDYGRILEGTDLLLTCDVTGYPKPEIGWSRLVNGGNVKLTEKDGQFTSNTFFVKNVRKDMSGTYYCFAINKVARTAASVNITVLSKPHVHAHRTIVNTDVGIEAELQCSAHEQPTPDFRWYKDGQLLEGSYRTFVINTNGPLSTLTVTPLSDKDFGTFTCEAKNDHGKHNRSIELVQSPVVEGFDINGPKLSWRVHSHQPLEDIEIQLRNLNEDGKWSRIQLPVPAVKSNKHEYEVIYMVEEKDQPAGKYEVFMKAKNNKGWSHHTEPAVVDIESQAQPIQTASVFRDGGSGATSFRPSAVLATTIMYLIVRMF